MALTNDLFNPMLDAAGGEIDSVSLHDDDPGSTGVNELAGGSYARQTPSWGSASGGEIQTSSALDFDVPGGNTVAWVGLWDSTGPTFLGGIQLDASEAFSSDGTYTVTSITLSLDNAA